MKTIIVDGKSLFLNTKDRAGRPIYHVTEGDQTTDMMELTISGPCKLMYDADRVGSKTWIETDSEILPMSVLSTIGEKIIHVNRQHISMNANDGGDRPVFTIKHRGQTRYARSVNIEGPCHLVYNGSQLSCGARAWISTTAEIKLIDEMSFKQARENAGNTSRELRSSD